MRDTYGNWILNCLGLADNGKYLDDIEESFGVVCELCSNETLELIKYTAEHNTSLGDVLASRIYDEVIDKAINELECDREDFEYYVNGSLDTSLMYKGEEVSNWAEIEALVDVPSEPKLELWCYGYSEDELAGYTIVGWPEIQDLQEKDGFLDHAYLVNDEEGLNLYGSSAYVVENAWMDYSNE